MIDPDVHRLVKRMWEDHIESGWKRASYSQALRSLTIALFYILLHHNLISHKENFDNFDKAAIVHVREVVAGTKRVTEEDFQEYERWLKALSEGHYLDEPKPKNKSAA
jgi:hypothetical protein